jgi:hypothetical protein
MPVPDGYVTKTNALAIIREQTGCGRFVAENKMAELAEAGTIRFVDNPGNRHLRLISRRDVDKIVAALTLPPPE